MTFSKLIELRNKKGEVVAHAVVDDIDYEFVMRWKWCLVGGKYVRRGYREGGKQKCMYLHREIAARAGLCLDDDIDHINHDRLDNRRSNLRAATRSQNLMASRRPNKLGVKGVQRTKAGRYTAMARVEGGETKYIGTYDTVEEAKAAWAEATSYRGEFQ